jgi:hypothetical protein
VFLLATTNGLGPFISAVATVLIIVLLVALELTSKQERIRSRRLFALCFTASALLYILAETAR